MLLLFVTQILPCFLLFTYPLFPLYFLTCSCPLTSPWPNWQIGIHFKEKPVMLCIVKILIFVCTVTLIEPIHVCRYSGTVICVCQYMWACIYIYQYLILYIHSQILIYWYIKIIQVYANYISASFTLIAFNFYNLFNFEAVIFSYSFSIVFNRHPSEFNQYKFTCEIFYPFLDKYLHLCCFKTPFHFLHFSVFLKDMLHLVVLKVA